MESSQRDHYFYLVSIRGREKGATEFLQSGEKPFERVAPPAEEPSSTGQEVQIEKNRVTCNRALLLDQHRN